MYFATIRVLRIRAWENFSIWIPAILICPTHDVFLFLRIHCTVYTHLSYHIEYSTCIIDIKDSYFCLEYFDDTKHRLKTFCSDCNSKNRMRTSSFRTVGHCSVTCMCLRYIMRWHCWSCNDRPYSKFDLACFEVLDEGHNILCSKKSFRMVQLPEEFVCARSAALQQVTGNILKHHLNWTFYAF